MGSRTHDPWFGRPLLFPTELSGHHINMRKQIWIQMDLFKIDFYKRKFDSFLYSNKSDLFIKSSLILLECCLLLMYFVYHIKSTHAQCKI